MTRPSSRGVRAHKLGSTFLALSLTALFGAAERRVPAATPEASAPGAAAAASITIAVTVTNPTAAKRPRETIAVTRADLAKVAPAFDLAHALVADASGGAVLSQIVDSDGDDAPDQIVFQTDLGAKEHKTFKLHAGTRSPAAQADYHAYGRFVRERHDDFAWENDLVAHRMYGPDLETTKKEPLVSSGIDVWVKRVPRLVVNEWYMTDDYHQDHGDGADFYSVGKSRGCGGLGVWAGGKLVTSRNFATSRVLANGPIRLIFELAYAPWEAGGAHIAEVKRVTLDAGSRFNHFESAFTVSGGGPVKIGLGISKHPGMVVERDTKAGWMRTWEPLDGGKGGGLGCAVVVAGAGASEAQQTDSDELLVAALPAGGRLTYEVGTAWDRAGGIADAAAWTADVRGRPARLGAPVKVALAVAK